VIANIIIVLSFKNIGMPLSKCSNFRKVLCAFLDLKMDVGRNNAPSRGIGIDALGLVAVSDFTPLIL